VQHEDVGEDGSLVAVVFGRSGLWGGLLAVPSRVFAEVVRDLVEL
jgi:hypothetical protein